MSTLTVDDLEFELRLSPRRRSVQITVDRGGELVLIAPEQCSQDIIESFVRSRRMWIFTKLAEKEALRHPAPAKQFVNGEGLRYLGRSYRLLFVEKQDVPVKLTGGRFCLRRRDAARAREDMVAWYTAHGQAWLSARLTRFCARVGVIVEDLRVQDLGYRWGSCGRRGAVNFHWKTILLPPRIIDYILVHELVHIHEPHHTSAFWARLERVLPDYPARKQWLADHGQIETSW
ncbi:hypothetical protein SAMN02745121_03315 [Nannocystis exedens]|uniref:YgjP-like metallopeptidase domain-containing protein n=1 Tax=Nannocystis exedens TaxID=54 RepID=A0A1I1YJB6_9BACT|nr:SprT family zinc-dependent metalloprotease [Nannocystis exedens]PCC70356.1 metal-dependent hydrolase [Nannocystis exedens]SFE19118.1 hypothetical protein SAMN02745121_03315 [Nannocystis exedens]